MAIEEFTIVLEEKLNCGKCDSVLLHLKDPLLLLVNDGALPEDIQSFLRASIVSFEEVAAASGCATWYRYTISYDDSFLLDPEFVLRDCDILKVCCVDCILAFVDEQGISNHILTTPSQGIVRLTRPDTTFDDVPASIFTTLPILGDGTAGDPVDLRISTDAGNILSLGTDTGVLGTVDTDATVDGDGTAGDPLSVPPSVQADNAIVLGADNKHFTAKHTAFTDEVGFIDSQTPWNFDSADPFTSDILGPLTIDNTANTRSVVVDAEIFFRPNFVFNAGEDSVIDVTVQVRIDGGPWNTLSIERIQRLLAGSAASLANSVDKNERIFETVAGGASKTIEARLLITSPNAAITSELDALNGSIRTFAVTFS